MAFFLRSRVISVFTVPGAQSLAGPTRAMICSAVCGDLRHRTSMMRDSASEICGMIHLYFEIKIHAYSASSSAGRLRASDLLRREQRHARRPGLPRAQRSVPACECQAALASSATFAQVVAAMLGRARMRSIHCARLALFAV